ncbi:hypothetical protein FGO68_gene13112 [Halteria grandinella]|uniref:Micro-fibrillar-associated protein 1 C-terminal domain-containing protein n=1 Tax=Halteria grandinella TaxID=5974 RepID=A0A8J8T202_HALGN|nr:hypothetical protein FGO68_gene13112 [Halteria grandinella]
MPVVVAAETGEVVQNPFNNQGCDDDEIEEDGDYAADEETQQQEPTLLKPVYVSKQDRELLSVTDEKRKQQEAEELEREYHLKKQEERRNQTKLLVAEAVQKELEGIKEHEAIDGLDSDDNLPDWAHDEDEDKAYLNLEQAYEDWKLRELKRLKRERDEKAAREKEAKEIERRRNMTDAERQEENLRLGSDHTNKKEKVAYKFMQRFYHKGAFFQGDQDSNPLFSRDYNMPVGEDKMDKSVLPAVLQKRRGQTGQKGNSKWTHLTAEDTTNFDPQHRIPDNIAFKTQLKQGGYKSMHNLDRPSARKRQF